MTLLCYHGSWFHTTDDMSQGRRISQLFDVIIEVTNNEFNVIKDRHRGLTGTEHPNSALFKVQLFTSGRTFYDLPQFTKSPSHSGGTVIGYKDNGDIFEYAQPTIIA